MIFEPLRAFVSSRMEELAPERATVKEALRQLRINSWLFEVDAGARPGSIKQTFLEEVEFADLYIGLFWKGYGEYTREEYQHAARHHKDRLIYEKRTELGGRDPRLQEFLDELAHVESGVTIRWFRTPEELAEFVKEDLAAWQARRIREKSRSFSPAASEPNPQQLAQLARLRDAVKRFWIGGVLENSVHAEVLLSLEAESRPDVLRRPWEEVLELPDQTGLVIPTDTPVSEIFDEAGRSLLILGAPGSGKTTTLLELARHLITRSEQQPAEGIPVVFNLSSWTGEHLHFVDYLVDELRTKYLIPERWGRQFLEEGRLVLLLDGLDEVEGETRGDCVEAIDLFIESGTAPGLVVCSRFEEYENLRVRLRLSAAICLRALRDDQIGDYLARGGPRLLALRAALAEDAELLELARSPLVLSIMALACADERADVLTVASGTTREERQRYLLDRYVDRMFARRGKREIGEPHQVMLGGLSQLAKGMQAHSQSIFLVEQLQPSWLTSHLQRVIYLITTRSAQGFLVGLFVTVLILSVLEPLSHAMDGFAGVMAGLGEFVATEDASRPQPGQPIEPSQLPIKPVKPSQQTWLTVWVVQALEFLRSEPARFASLLSELGWLRGLDQK